MKFLLKQISRVQTRTNHSEERYHYESEDGQHTLVFNAGEEPWSWEMIGSLSRPQAMAVIEKFCEKALNDHENMDEVIKELEVSI
jgi:hypothetical protein